ncbi:MAG: hypothetical protein JWM98_1204 [Thermoleophilia bacterium]|nr:hypothetical protein [Thermoleophilia bacterium]
MTTTTGKDAGSAATPVRSVLLHGAGSLCALVLLPLCLAIGVPFVAWAIGAGLVLVNRIAHAVTSWSVRDASLTVALGAVGFSMVFRALITALALFFVGAAVGGSGDRAFGLDRPDLARPAIIVFLICFTLDAAIEALRRAAQRDELAAAAPPIAVTPRETTA